jgi:hypothetical protein
MWRLAFLSITSLLACSDNPQPACGPGSAADTIDVVAGATTISYGDLSAGANNDCPDPMAPAGIVSITIERPFDGNGVFTLCIKRPDKLAAGLQLGTDVKVVDVTATSGGCSYLVDNSTPATGTAKATGLCKNGTDKAGFALVLNGTVTLSRMCGSTTDQVAATIDGTVAIAAQ